MSRLVQSVVKEKSIKLINSESVIYDWTMDNNIGIYQDA